MARQTRSKTAPKAPRTFSYPWGSGIVEEEVQIISDYHRPTLQLLRFTSGEPAGVREIRFCHYNHRGMFQRSPLLVNEKDIAALRLALRDAPKLRRILARLVGA